MSNREKLLILASLLELEADFLEMGCAANPVTLRSYSRELERIAARDAWAPFAFAMLIFTVGVCGGLLWHAYVL
jgi:hypothetical protein